MVTIIRPATSDANERLLEQKDKAKKNTSKTRCFGRIINEST